ncbi:hypothetical protein QA612_15220 [Evansella sp. AB-P1]|uniref:hypothetical protein n=1 Tax=Evansella sp. AB-P1 TaxID=3037653 RepID=UPI0024201F84|nr:hypothetical protein [Evansella sp. AB-P1]MDG5788821.1 hypothetical protein [Evansella sp. AB-P1]
MDFSRVPDIKPEIRVDRDDTINLLLLSIAYEELGLAHILHAEAEKIQSSLGTLPNLKVKDVSYEELLELNKEMNKTLKNVIKKEMILLFKLEEVIDLIEEDDDDDDEG